MKKYLFTLMFVLFGASAVLGQETKAPDAFDCEDGCWLTCLPKEDFPFPEYIMAYRMCNDTVIDGDVWRKLYSYKVRYDEFRSMNIDFPNLEYGDAVGCIRSEKGKVYGIVLNPEGFMYHASVEANFPVLLYDFSKEVGEYVNIGSDENPINEEMVLDEIGGYSRKSYGQCVEGIGSLLGGPFGPVQAYVTGDNPSLLYCSADGETIYGSMPVEELKYAYDLFAISFNQDYRDARWVVGRIKDGKVTETYTLSRQRGEDPYSRQYIVSSLDPKDEKDISYGGGYYDPNGKLYCKIGETQHLLYNFKMQVGETFDNGTKSMTVTSVDTMMIEGFERPVLTFDNGEQWIDGLGSTRGLLSPVTEDSEEYEEVLLSCVAGETVMYVNPEYGSGINETEYLKSEIRLNGTVLEITAPEDASHTVVVYDAGGNAVVHKTFDGAEYTLSVSSLQHGVYIVAVDGIACGKIVL